jgi:hypothetical protein
VPRSTHGIEKTHWRVGTCGSTRSTRWAASSAILRPPHEGQKARPLHENGTSRSSVHEGSRRRRHDHPVPRLRGASRRPCSKPSMTAAATVTGSRWSSPRGTPHSLPGRHPPYPQRRGRRSPGAPGRRPGRGAPRPIPRRPTSRPASAPLDPFASLPGRARRLCAREAPLVHAGSHGSPSRAKAAPSALREAGADTPNSPRPWSIACSRTCRCASGSSRCHDAARPPPPRYASASCALASRGSPHQRGGRSGRSRRQLPWHRRSSPFTGAG